MSAFSLIVHLSVSLTIQFMLWFNLLLPYNSLFENFSRHYYFIFSLSGFFVACISLAFYRLLVFEKVKKMPFVIASVLQFLSLLSCACFFVSSLTGWMPI
jgi:hypothetical protein